MPQQDNHTSALTGLMSSAFMLTAFLTGWLALTERKPMAP